MNRYTVDADRIYIAEGVAALFAWLRAGATLVNVGLGDYA